MLEKMKKDAKLILRQQLGKIIILLYIQVCAWTAFGFIFGAGAELFHISPPFPGLFTDAGFVGALLLLALITVAALMVLPPLWLGLRCWLYKVSDDPDLPLWEAFSYFSKKKYLQAVYYGCRMLLLHILHAVCFLAPGFVLLAGCFRLFLRSGRDLWQFVFALGVMVGFCLILVGFSVFIWFSQRYYLVAAFLCEGCSVNEAIKRSVTAMSQSKSASAKMWISYIPMFLSCLLIVPALYVVPHFLCASAIFSKVLVIKTK